MKSVNRIKKNKQFNYIYKKGQKRFSKNISMFFVKSSFTDVKVGFSVSKKIGKSVIRSKVKRRMKESFRNLLPQIKKHNNFVFVAKEGIENLSFLEIKQQIEELINNAGLFNENR